MSSPLRALLCQLPTQAKPEDAKLDMTVSADCITAQLKIKFDRKPDSTMENDLLTALKQYGCKWEGFGDQGKWVTDKDAVIMFEEKTFRARVKKCCKGLSFYSPEGTSVDMITFIDAVKNFDPDALDDDLSTLGKSKVAPDTPASAKRAR